MQPRSSLFGVIDMPRLFWLALLLGYLAGAAGAVLFLPGPLVEPLYAGIAVATLAMGGAVFTLVLATRGGASPAAFGEVAGAATALVDGSRAAAGEEGVEDEAWPEGAQAPTRLIAIAADDRISAAELREILYHRGVDAFVRPVVGLPRPETQSYHAVARLRTGRGEHLEPARYRATAARCGLLGLIDRLLVAGCAQALRAAQDAGHDQRIFCPISPDSLNDAGFVAEIGGLLREEPEVARRLIIELEQIRLHRPARETLAALVGQGLQLCLRRLSLDGLDLATLAEYGFAFVRIETPPPAISAGRDEIDPRLLTVRHLLDQAGITLVPDRIGAPRRPLASADRPWSPAEDELRSASVA